jgi:hypothetical protein
VRPVFVSKNGRFDYTTNWTGALRLFDSLVALGKGRVTEYERARRLVSYWLRAHPLKSQRWGPFFEDINIYSDTQINAGTMATTGRMPSPMRSGTPPRASG